MFRLSVLPVISMSKLIHNRCTCNLIIKTLRLRVCKRTIASWFLVLIRYSLLFWNYTKTIITSHHITYYMEESVLLGTKPVFTSLHPGPEWRFFRMSPLWVSYRSMTSRFPPFAFVKLVSPYNNKPPKDQPLTSSFVGGGQQWIRGLPVRVKYSGT